MKRKPTSIWHIQLSEHRAWNGALAATAINAIGMILEHFIGKPVVNMPTWPPFVSGATGLILFVVLLTRRSRPSLWLANAIYAVNAASVIATLMIANPYYAEFSPHWVPFQANKLGCLIAAVIAPSFTVGLLSIFAHAAGSTWQYLSFSAEIKSRLPIGEPMAMLVFATVGVVVLVFRYRRVALERTKLDAQAEIQATQKFAQMILSIRDQMNSPLQALTLATATLKKQNAEWEAVPAVERAVDRLTNLASQLATYDPRSSHSPKKIDNDTIDGG